MLRLFQPCTYHGTAALAGPWVSTRPDLSILKKEFSTALEEKLL